jgi:predicted transcriptional regulator of viral defense system
MSDRTIGRRVAQGRLHRVLAGVYAIGHPRLTQAGRWMAAVVACGQGAVLSHLDAAALWGFYNGIGALIHVTVASHRRVKGLILHRTRRLDPEDVTVKNGIPVTTVERTFVALTECLSEDRQLRALREAEFQGLLDLDALDAAVERAHGRRKLAALKRAIAKHRPGQIIRGELEHRAPPSCSARAVSRSRSSTCPWKPSEAPT